MRLKYLFTVVVILLAVFFAANFSYAQTGPAAVDLQELIKQLQTQVQALQEQVATLQAELGKTPEPSIPASTPAETPPASQPEITPPELTRSLSRGSSGDDVRKLQEFLSKDKEIYPEGLITGFFGPRTEVAVKKWQEKHGIESVGIVGPKTIAKLQDIGRGVIQRLLSQGAGQSGIVPPGFLKKAESATTAIPSGAIPAQPIGQTGTTTIPAIPQIPTQISTTTSTTTPSGTIPATPAQPAQPVAGGATVPATPAIPATPAVITTATSTATTTATVTPPIFTVTSPNGGEQWTAGNTYTVTWASAGTAVSKVNIEVYKAGVYNTTIAYDASNTGSISWTIPATLSVGSDYKIRIYNNAYSNNFDESNNAFSVTVPVSAPSAPSIGYWKFDGSGNNEISGSPNAVTIGNSSFKTSGGKFGGYLYMTSSADYAKIPYNSIFNLPNSFTVEFWFRQRSNQSFNQNLVYRGTPVNNYNFNIFRNLWNQNNNGAVIAGSTASGTGYWHQVSNPNEPPHNQWHHIIYTKTTTGATYYIDGEVIHTRSYGPTGYDSEYYGPVKTPAVDIIIGNPAPDTDIDNLRIYNYALSRAEVLYNWGETPGASTAVDDTAPPSTPTNITATATSSTETNLSWTASSDNIGVVGYRIYRGGTQITTVTTGTSYSDTGLSAATSYSYAIAAYDAAGNVSTQSNPVSVTTLSAGPSAPTNIQVVTTSGSQSQPPQMWYFMTFNYTLQSTTQSFNVYRKRPTDASFVKYTYSAQTPVNGSILPLPGSGESNLYHRGTNQWEWWTTLTDLAPDTVQGEYKFYATAVDANNNESVSSETKSFRLYAPPAITSPANGSTISAPFAIAVSGDPNASSPSYGMALYKKTTGDTAWSVWPAPSTSFTYTGSALNPVDNPHRLVVWFSSGSYDRSLFGTSIFNISTTTSAISSDRDLATVLRSLSAVLQKLQKALR